MSANIGINIRNARKALHLSQEELGEMIGANRVTISRYETCEYNPSLPALKRLAEALQTTPAELSGDDSDTKKEPATVGGFPIEGYLQLIPENRKKIDELIALYVSAQSDGQSHASVQE